MKRMFIITSIVSILIALNINFVVPNLNESPIQNEQRTATDSTSTDSTTIQDTETPKEEIRYFGRGSFEKVPVIEKKKMIKTKSKKSTSK